MGSLKGLDHQRDLLAELETAVVQNWGPCCGEGTQGREIRGCVGVGVGVGIGIRIEAGGEDGESGVIEEPEEESDGYGPKDKQFGVFREQ